MKAPGATSKENIREGGQEACPVTFRPVGSNLSLTLCASVSPTADSSARLFRVLCGSDITGGQKLFCLLLALAGLSFLGAGQVGGWVCLSSAREDVPQHLHCPHRPGEAAAGPQAHLPRARSSV